jgi:hypothetical protein
MSFVFIKTINKIQKFPWGIIVSIRNPMIYLTLKTRRDFMVTSKNIERRMKRLQKNTYCQLSRYTVDFIESKHKKGAPDISSHYFENRMPPVDASQ